MSRERWFTVLVQVEEENDGPAYLRRGHEPSKEVLTVGAAIATYGRKRIVELLREALDRATEGERPTEG